MNPCKFFYFITDFGSSDVNICDVVTRGGERGGRRKNQKILMAPPLSRFVLVQLIPRHVRLQNPNFNPTQCSLTLVITKSCLDFSRLPNNFLHTSPVILQNSPDFSSSSPEFSRLLQFSPGLYSSYLDVQSSSSFLQNSPDFFSSCPVFSRRLQQFTKLQFFLKSCVTYSYLLLLLFSLF